MKQITIEKNYALGFSASWDQFSINHLHNYGYDFSPSRSHFLVFNYPVPPRNASSRLLSLTSIIRLFSSLTRSHFTRLLESSMSPLLGNTTHDVGLSGADLFLFLFSPSTFPIEFHLHLLWFFVEPISQNTIFKNEESISDLEDACIHFIFRCFTSHGSLHHFGS